MRRLAWLWFVAGLTVPAAVMAAATPIAASMVVTGTITVNPDGDVNSYTLDHQDEVPLPVVALVKQTVARWKFKPVVVGGRPVVAKAGMALRIVAHETGDGRATAQIIGANFGCDAWQKSQSPECSADTSIRPIERKKPGYPMNLARVGVGGVVYVVLRVGADGRVVKAAVRQINLRARMGPHNSEVASQELGRATLSAASDWTFRVPTSGSEAAKSHWIVVVPVVFTARAEDDVHYGQWMAYIPGPVQVIPWARDDQQVAASANADALPDGAVFHADTRFVLLTPFAHSMSPPAGAFDPQG